MIKAIGVINNKKIIAKIIGLKILDRIKPTKNQKVLKGVKSSGLNFVTSKKQMHSKKNIIAKKYNSLTKKNNEIKPNIREKEYPKFKLDGLFDKLNLL